MATGISITKAVVFTVLSVPTGISATKADAFSVLSPPKGVSVSKAAVFTVLRSGVSVDGQIPNYACPTSTSRGPNKSFYTAVIPSYPDISTVSYGHHYLPYTAAIPSYPSIKSVSSATNVIPEPPPPGTNLVNLVAPIDAVDRGMAPDHFGGMGATEFLREMFIIDTNDYDGTVTYEHQIIARNTSSTPYYVDLRKYYYPTPVSSILVPANTTAWTLFTAAFTPDPGENRYFWNVPDAGGGYSYLQVATGRVIVHQTGATKTLLWRPMSTYIEGTCDGFNKATGYSFYPGTWVSGGVGTFRWTPSLYQADLVTMVLECCVGSAYGDITTRCCLWDLTDDVEVSGTAFDIGSGGAFSFPSGMARRHEFSTALLTANHIYSTKYQRVGCNGGLMTWWLSSAFYHRSSIGIRMYNISRCEVVWRVCKGYGAPVEETRGSSRAKITTGGGTTVLYYAKNETDSIPDTYFSEDTQQDFYITNDDGLDSGDAGSATNISGSNAVQYNDSTPYYLPIYSNDFKGSFVEGDHYAVRQGPAIVGSDANAAWTLVCLGFGPPTSGGGGAGLILPTGCSIC